ncbi:MAG: DUF5011 domain-containing protein [Bacteroidales bacterium]|jgi:hypothetical protein|nr:DUF5011 domain-containing protein [Bacteroidales bacterium]
MKKINILLILGLVALLMFSCSNDKDTTPPVITLHGSSDTTIALNTQWTDPGATAIDDEDGNVPINASGVVNKDLVGVYIITYQASDAAGNISTKTRTVRVRNMADIWEGDYSVTDNSGGIEYTYTDHISISQTQNTYVNVNKFRNYINGTLEFYFTKPDSLNSSIVVNIQNITCGEPYINRYFYGMGQITSLTNKTFELFVNENDGTSTISIVESYQKN